MKHLLGIVLSLVLAGSAFAGTVRFYNINEPEFIDPPMATGAYENQIIIALFEGLTEYDPRTLAPIPGIARSWKVSPDGKTYTFNLREDAKWSNGRPVTAQDFVYSWERALNPKKAAEYAFQLFAIHNAEGYNQGKISDFSQVGIKAPNDHTLVVTLDNPTPYFLFQTGFMTLRPVPKEAVEKFGPTWTKPENIVTSGAYKLTSWVPNDKMVVEKNPHYWDAKSVKTDVIHFIPMEDKMTALKQYDSGKLDVLWELPFVMQTQLASSADYISAPFFSTVFLRLNVKRGPLQNPKFREALGLAIDRDTLTKEYLHGLGVPTATLIPPLRGYTPPVVPGFDPARAKALLTESGIDPATVTLNILYNTDDINKTVLEVIQQMWQKNLGIRVSLFNQEWKTFLKTQSAGDFEVSRSRWVGDYPDATSFLDMWLGSSSMNYTGWKNAEYDTLLAKAKMEPNVAKRAGLLRSAEQLMLNGHPILPLFVQKKTMRVQPTMHGFYPTILDIHPSKYWYVTEGSLWNHVRMILAGG